jgi:hypothetical protein
MHCRLCRANCVLILAGFTALGCNKTDPAKPTAAAAGQPPAKTNSVWEPDPGWAGELTQSLTFDKYQVSAPKGLVAVPDATKTVGAFHVFTWKIDTGPGVPGVLLSVTITDDKKTVAEARRNMKQALVNFTAGSTDPLGIKARRMTEVETGTLAGIPFSRYTWKGTGRDSQGLSYGGLDGDRNIMILAICFGSDAKADLAQMQAVIATLKKS